MFALASAISVPLYQEPCSLLQTHGSFSSATRGMPSKPGCATASPRTGRSTSLVLPPHVKTRRPGASERNHARPSASARTPSALSDPKSPPNPPYSALRPPFSHFPTHISIFMECYHSIVRLRLISSPRISRIFTDFDEVAVVIGKWGIAVVIGRVGRRLELELKSGVMRINVGC